MTGAPLTAAQLDSLPIGSTVICEFTERREVRPGVRVWVPLRKVYGKHSPYLWVSHGDAVDSVTLAERQPKLRPIAMGDGYAERHAAAEAARHARRANAWRGGHR